MPSCKRERPCRPPQERSRRRAASTLALLVVSGWMTPEAACFAPSISHQERVATRRYFRHAEDGVVSTLQSKDMAASILSGVASNPIRPSTVDKMPSWLSVPRAHLYEKNLKTLREAMMNSFFTENEALKVLLAIEEAAGGDKNKMAGAAEFCLILVETMEMGANAIVAAAFHYCSCVAARERSLLMPSTVKFSHSAFWDHHHNEQHGSSSIHTFGEHPVAIARDAARLKRIEMVAASVMQNGKSVRVSPDSRDAENLRKLLLTETKDWRALAIRSAACLYRLRGILASGSVDLTPEIVRVSREALHIYAPLASRLGMHRLKNELEDAAFRILYKRQFETVNSLARQSRRRRTKTAPWSSNYMIELMSNDADAADASIVQTMQDVIDGVTMEVSEMLSNDTVFSSVIENVSVTARVKEAYSMWRKMLRDDLDHILQVPDSLALRIVLDAKKLSADEDPQVTRARERALCYYAQQLCMERWRPNEKSPRFKDYIERPKPNGYQSLHYTASTKWGDDDWSLEIQVRSGEMHKVAEYGLASHWDYKSAGKSEQSGSPETTTKDAYLKSVQEWHWQQQSGASRWDASPATSEEPLETPEAQSKIRADRIRARTARLQPYIEALTEAQSDLVREHVFVFLSQGDTSVHTDGKVLALPAGACVLDALREGERRFGIKMNLREEKLDGVMYNGATANVTKKLSNGDVLTVPVQQEMQEAISSLQRS